MLGRGLGGSGNEHSFPGSPWVSDAAWGGRCGGRALTMSTPKDHQSALCVCPRRFTTSGAMYSIVPQKE